MVDTLTVTMINADRGLLVCQPAGAASRPGKEADKAGRPELKVLYAGRPTLSACCGR